MLEKGALQSAYDIFENSSTGRIYAEKGKTLDTLSQAVHLAPELIDRGYAGEKDNEPFIYFPAEVICTNYAFSGSEQFNFNPYQKGTYANWEVLKRDSNQ